MRPVANMVSLKRQFVLQAALPNIRSFLADIRQDFENVMCDSVNASYKDSVHILQYQRNLPLGKLEKINSWTYVKYAVI